jgi:hypothetical protein
MSFGPVRLHLVCAVFVASCGGGAPKATITMVTPSRAYSDLPLRLTIHGQGFLPAFQIDQAAGLRRGEDGQFEGQVGTGTEPVLLHSFDWVDKNTLTALMDAGLPPGQHAIEVTDPRGQPARKEMAFWSLGRDNDPPKVVFEKPSPMAPVVGGSTLDVAISASDPEPGLLSSLTWQAFAGGEPLEKKPHECRFESTRDRARCDFQLVVPVWLGPGDQFEIRAVAVDTAAAGNRVVEVLPFTIQHPPAVTAINPIKGGLAGGTDLVIRGAGFFPGSKAYVGGVPILPDGGVVMNPQTIYGRTPPHAEGPVTVLVRTPIGDAPLDGIFEYAPPPQIETILPETGDPDGATPFRVRGRGFTDNTQIFFGDSLVGAQRCEVQRVVSDSEISGTAPSGRGRTSVWAFDADLGWTRLADGFGWSGP